MTILQTPHSRTNGGEIGCFGGRVAFFASRRKYYSQFLGKTLFVFFPIVAAVGWVLIHISKPAREQLDRDFSMTGDEGSSYGDFRDMFAPVKEGPWTTQTPKKFTRTGIVDR